MLAHPFICKSIMPSVLKVFWSTRCHVPGLVCLFQHMLDSIPFAVHRTIQFMFYLLKYMLLLFMVVLLCAQRVYSQAHTKFVLFRKQLCSQADSFLEQVAHNLCFLQPQIPENNYLSTVALQVLRHIVRLSKEAFQRNMQLSIVILDGYEQY